MDDIANEKPVSFSEFERRDLIEENQRLTLENKKLDAACKVWEEYEEKFHEHLETRDKRIEKLTAALKKISIDDDINSNFSRSEDECAYYIEIARKALAPDEKEET